MTTRKFKLSILSQCATCGVQFGLDRCPNANHLAIQVGNGPVIYISEQHESDLDSMEDEKTCPDCYTEYMGVNWKRARPDSRLKKTMSPKLSPKMNKFAPIYDSPKKNED
jgi:hypothetical protein